MYFGQDVCGNVCQPPAGRPDTYCHLTSSHAPHTSELFPVCCLSRGRIFQSLIQARIDSEFPEATNGKNFAETLGSSTATQPRTPSLYGLTTTYLVLVSSPHGSFAQHGQGRRMSSTVCWLPRPWPQLCKLRNRNVDSGRRPARARKRSPRRAPFIGQRIQQ